MRYLNKLIKLFVEDKLLALGILLSLIVTKLLVEAKINPELSGPLFVICLMCALSISIVFENQRKAHKNQVHRR